MGYSVELLNIRKEYPGVIANDGITIRIREGAVLCLVGENGAGKSTLMNILYGLEHPDEGEILVNGESVRFSSSREAIAHHIGMVHQHFMLIGNLSVLENIILGMEPRRGMSLDYKRARAEAAELGRRFGMEVPLERRVDSLPVGVQQKVEILKILYRGADIIILDEPTAVLTPQETQELFENIRQLVGQGKTVVLITHKLDEVMRIADDIVVMRRGQVVASMPATETNAAALAVHMVGKELPTVHERIQVSTEEKILEVQGISVTGEHGMPTLSDVSFTIRRGEILGVAGVSGNGQGELAQAVAGLVRLSSGKVLLEGVDVTAHGRRERLLDGISYIPEDRKEVGLCLPWSIADNVVGGYHILPQFEGRFGLVKTEEINRVAIQAVEHFDVRTPSHLTGVGSLSGGNQQKVVIARETMNGPKLIIASEPTRGVDIGAISFIHNNLIDLRNSGTAVLLFSSDLDEVFRLSDRIAVLFQGRVAAVVDPKAITREELGLYMAGVKGGEEVWTAS